MNFIQGHWSGSMPVKFFLNNGTQGSVRIDLQFGPDPELGPEFEMPWYSLSAAYVCMYVCMYTLDLYEYRYLLHVCICICITRIYINLVCMRLTGSECRLL